MFRNIAQALRTRFVIEALDPRRLLSVTLPGEEVSDGSAEAEVEILVVDETGATDGSEEIAYLDDSATGEELMYYSLMNEALPEEEVVADPDLIVTCYFGEIAENELVDPYVPGSDEVEILTLGGEDPAAEEYEILTLGEIAETGGPVVDAPVAPPPATSSLFDGADTHGHLSSLLSPDSSDVLS